MRVADKDVPTAATTGGRVLRGGRVAASSIPFLLVLFAAEAFVVVSLGLEQLRMKEDQQEHHDTVHSCHVSWK